MFRPGGAAGRPTPHARGAAGQERGQVIIVGTNPARAGSTTAACVSPQRIWDQPRTCGEHTKHIDGRPGGWDQLLTCGEHAAAAALMTYSQGPAPHVRGAPVEVQGAVGPAGTSPVRAGNTNVSQHPIGNDRDQPRTCGEPRAAAS